MDVFMNVLNWILENNVRCSIKLTEYEARMIPCVILGISALREGRLIDIYYVVG